MRHVIWTVRPLCEMWEHLIREAPKLIDFVTDRPDEYLLSAGTLEHPNLVNAVVQRANQRSITEISGRLTWAHEHSENRVRLSRVVCQMHVHGRNCVWEGAWRFSESLQLGRQG